MYNRTDGDKLFETKDIDSFDEDEQIQLVKVTKQCKYGTKLQIDDTFTILKKYEGSTTY